MQYISQQQQQWILELIFKKQRENFEIFGRNFRQMNNTQVLGHMAAAYYISIGYWTAQNCESLYLVHIYFPLEEAIHRVFYYLFQCVAKVKVRGEKNFYGHVIFCVISLQKANIQNSWKLLYYYFFFGYDNQFRDTTIN